MDKIVIKGGNTLTGEITINGAKNAALPIMIASLLTEDSMVLSNIPILADITTLIELLESHGVKVKKELCEDNSSSLVLNAAEITNFEAHYDIVSKMRASLWVLAPLMARFGKARVSLPGGCAIGTRQVDLYISFLQAMGAEINIEEGYINASKKGRLNATSYQFNKVSVGATICAIMAATLADGTSHFSNCAIEPEIVDVCNCLIKMGAIIEGIGTKVITIHGVEKLKGTHHTVIPDRIEAGTYMVAASITRGSIKIKNINYDIIENTCLALAQAGSKIEHGDNYINVSHQGAIIANNISTSPYPGFATDMQAQFMALMTIANGTSIITETLYENRFMHALELARLGADITVQGSSAVIKGVPALKGAELMATDLRASAALILAGLVAEGTTIISRVYHIDRGYMGIEKKLKACGADIERIKA